jgi:signal transduction histidine kinase/ligand-binding sensor domain-containing protein
VVLGLLFSLCPVTHAQQYFKKWATEEGLPQNNVINIAQTPDGYLWLATVDGLARFDGVRFKVFNKANTPEMPNNRIHSMFTDTAGRLWFTYRGDQTIVVYENGRFKSFVKGLDFEKDEQEPTVASFIDRYRHLLRSPEMRFRAGDSEYVYKNGSFVARPAGDYVFPSRVFATDFESVWIDDGDALYHIHDSRVTRYRKGGPLPFEPKQMFPVDSTERDGILWFFSDFDVELPYNRLCSFKDGKLKTFPQVFTVQELEFDTKGNLWISVWNKGVVRIDSETIARNDPANFRVKDDLKNPGWGLFRDRDGNVWFGGINGLYLTKPEPAVTVYSQATGLPADNVYPIVQDKQGTIWFGAWNDKLISYRDGRFSSEHALLLTTLFVDSRAWLWKGMRQNIYYRENAGWVPVNFKETLPLPWRDKDWSFVELAFITEDRQGNMWFGNEGGLIRYAPGGSQIFTVNDGLPSNVVTSYLFTRSGEMWVGTNGGIARMENGRFRAFTEKDGLAGNYTRSFYEDAEGTIWIGGYDGGLTRYKNGSLAKITKRDGLFSDGVFVILEDEDGWFWMNSNQGIYRVRRQELNDFAEGKVESVTSVSYGPEDGLLEVEGNGGWHPAGLKATDGKLWFPTAHGVAVIDPKTAKRASIPPPVLVEEVRIDQKPFGIAAEGIRLEPDQVALEIDYTALGFVGAERMRFRYRLEGLDEAWTEAGTRRTAYFSHLPYGTYTLRVIAANYDGIWNTEGATVNITVVPPFYRKWWFYALAILGVFGIITSVYLLRIQQLKTLNEARAGFTRRLIESQEGERRRIALELHDSLGQILAVIRNRTIIGLEAKDTAQVFEQLREISEASSLALRETREIAHNLHPAQIENLGLTTALRSLAKSVESSAGMKCEANISETPGSLPYEAAISIYRITQECLGNIIKHSGASFASVSLRLNDGKLVLSIKDDGRGFLESQTPKGLGLTGIRERAKMIGAELTINSQLGEGTSVSLVLPIS